MVENRFKNKDLDEIFSDMWFGDDTPSDYSEQDFKNYVNDLNKIFPDANITNEEKQTLLDLFLNYKL